MNFGSGGSSKSKAWRDVWGVGSIADVPSVTECIARLRQAYATACADLARRAAA